jgi:hydrogenase nickel incorporation protein HypA/HybF
VTKGSLAEGALLDILVPEGRARCHGCHRTVVISDRFSGCPRCGGVRLEIIAGKELRIKDLEVE